MFYIPCWQIVLMFANEWQYMAFFLCHILRVIASVFIIKILKFK